MIGRLAPPLLWAALIFAASSVPGDSLPPAVPHVDKVLHAGAYAVLGGLLARALGVPSGARQAAAVLLAALYGVADEIHQAFVPGRDPEVADVVADALGAACGAWLMRLATRRRRGRS